MKKANIMKMIPMIILILTMTACDKEEKKVIIEEEPGKTITVIENKEQEEESKPNVTADRIVVFDKVINITDWLDENTVLVSKENTTLDKMSLAELSETYPRSLYLLDLNTMEYKLLKEEKDVYLDGAVLSADRKYLLYSLNTLGDPSFYMMNMETSEAFGIMGDPIGAAMTAKWADSDTIIGVAYSGGAYLADRTGEITPVEELKEEALYLLEKIGDTIFYNTVYDPTLMKLDLNTGEKVKLPLEQVYEMHPSPDGKQLLLLQADGAKSILTVYDLASKEKATIAEGAEIRGVSWSPDQRRIAYHLKEEGNNTSKGSLYVYDMLTGEANWIIVGNESFFTSWSPSGTRLIFTEWTGTQNSSSIIYLK